MHPKAKAIRVYDYPEAGGAAVSQRWKRLTGVLPFLVLAFVLIVMMMAWILPGVVK